MPPHPAGPLGSDQRVRKRSEFREIQAEAVRVTTHRFVLLLRQRGDSQRPRLGVTASRRIGGAVARNRMKRLIREAFRATRDLWAAGLDVVVVARASPTGLDLARVVQEWRAASATLARKSEEAARDSRRRAAAHSTLAKSP